ncbi:hypothetical protein [Pyxidicoccus xibeiensis]|uniref:hypothetical protein n=1 Tax=Pyxidicoccus xibeiensis TaxID=2906759 RepID=UPI0020A74D5F|nr:hypothetical protein [Pyxidicoccus xibeiensis]MCP3139424.1 hypothetical protein [Pyxidicoccus xibeiensis]
MTTWTQRVDGTQCSSGQVCSAGVCGPKCFIGGILYAEDDTQSAAFPVTRGTYHVYELAVDAAKVATVSIDGVAKLTRNNFTANGSIASGDQTNDANVDGAMRINSVERLCP